MGIYKCYIPRYISLIYQNVDKSFKIAYRFFRFQFVQQPTDQPVTHNVGLSGCDTKIFLFVICVYGFC